MNIYWNFLTVTFAGAVCSLWLLLLPLDHQVNEQSILSLSLSPPLIKTHGSVASLLWILSRGRPWDANFKYYDDVFLHMSHSIAVHNCVFFVQRRNKANSLAWLR